MTNQDVLDVEQVAEYQLLAAAGLTMDETIPLDLYRTMYPDVLTMPQRAREDIYLGVLGSCEEAILLAYLLHQRYVADLPEIAFDEETVAAIEAFRRMLNLAGNESFTDYESVTFYGGRVNALSAELFPLHTETFQMGRAAIRANLYEGFLVPETEENDITVAALTASKVVLEKLLAASVKAS